MNMSSKHDDAILNSIFNPLLPVGENVLDEDLPSDIQDADDSNVCAEVKDLELEGVRSAESGDLDKAIGLFTRAINIAPERSSGYNNRAQALRLKGNVADAIEDLNKAVALSGGVGRSGCRALCQRGLIHRKEGRNEVARCDFERAAKLGSNFAKGQLVQLNPYAALCNKMLHSVMTNLQMQHT